MELNLCVNYHNRHAFRFTSPSAFSLSTLRSVRTHFLGSAHTLRPPLPPLQYRKKCNRLGLLRLHSPRFVFKASLQSHSLIVVVVLVTLSAVSILRFTLNNRKKSRNQTRGHAKFALSRQGSNVGNQVIESQILGFPEFQRDNPLSEIGNLTDHNAEDNHILEEKESQLPLLKSSLVHEASFMTNISESSTPVLDSSFNNSSSRVLEESILPDAFQSTVLQPLAFAEEMALQVEENQDQVDSDPESPLTIVKSEHATSSVGVNNELTTIDEQTKENIDAISFDVLFGESARQELYMFYEDNKSTVGSMSPLSSLKSLSLHASTNNVKGLPSTMRNTTLKGSDISTEISPQGAEYIEGVVPISSHTEGYTPQNGSKHSRKGGRALPAKVFPNNGHSINMQFDQKSDQTRVEDDQKNDHSDYLSRYNKLLKAARPNFAITFKLDELTPKCIDFVRLHESLELLKDMETKGLLDMTKIYHAKFFNVCKRKRAVKEAFDYIRLIPNPTLSTFNMLMSVCTSSQDSERAFEVLKLLKEARLEPDCKLYTTLISTCAKSGKVDTMFEMFHKMVNSGVEPNVHTYGALIDGCARAGQIAKAFGAYGILRSKNVKPDRVVFNALIAACAQSGAVDRAFDVLAEMAAEIQPIDPDHITIGALMKACANAGQVERALEVYKMLQKYNLKGTPEVYTIAINSCSQTGDWEFACSVYNDMTQKGVLPDEMFLSALIDVAGHAKKLDAAFDVLKEARKGGIHIGMMSYSSLMGACSNARNWEKALELYEYLKAHKLVRTVSTVNALLTALCDGNQFQRALEVLSEMKGLGLCPNSITFSVLLTASEKNDDMEAAQMLLSQAKMEGVALNVNMCRCIIGMCLQRYERDCFVGEPVLSFNSGRAQVNNKWTSLALAVYRETLGAGEKPTSEILSRLLGCLQLPYDASVKNRLVDNLGVSTESSRNSNLRALVDGFGEYDIRAFSILEEAASYGVVSSVSFKVSPIVVDAKDMHTSTAEVYLLTVLKGLKHRLAAGARLSNIIILLPVEKTKVSTQKGEKMINLANRVGQAVAALFRRLKIPYQGHESSGKLRINGLALKKWFQPKLASFSGKPGDWSSSPSRLGKRISHQQRRIRTGNLSLD